MLNANEIERYIDDICVSNVFDNKGAVLNDVLITGKTTGLKKWALLTIKVKLLFQRPGGDPKLLWQNLRHGLVSTTL